MKKILFFLLGIVLLLSSVVLLYYTHYSTNCYKKSIVYIVDKDIYYSKGIVYDTCLQKLVKMFELEVNKATMSSIENPSIDKCYLLARENIKKQTATDCVFISLSDKNLFSARIRELNKDSAVLPLFINENVNFYVPKLGKLQQVKINDALFKISSGDIVRQRVLVNSFIKTLKNYPYDFQKLNLEVFSSKLSNFLKQGKKYIKEDLVSLVEKHNLDNFTIVEILVLFSFMDAYNISSFSIGDYPYLGFVK